MSKITETEFDVLAALWDKSPQSAQQIIEILNKQKFWHEKTVKTLLNRLVKKEAVGFEKEARKYLYYPLIAKEQYQNEESETLIQRLFSGNLSPFVANFAKRNKLNKLDVEELKQVIEKWEKEND